MHDPLVAVVILNTNRREDTLECLDSLAQTDSYKRQRVIVLDNASTDGSVAAIESRFPAVQVIRLDENRGYAGNNNVGITEALNAHAHWVLVLNEDTLLAPDCIARMVNAGEADPQIGIVGPLILHYSEPEIIQSAGGRMNVRWQAWHHLQNAPCKAAPATPFQVDWVSGCAIMVRRAVIEQIGMFDERFFYYWEETEWCIRAQRAGWRVLVEPAAQLWHKGVQRNYRPKPSVSYYDTRNHLLLMRKHGAPLAAWFVTTGQKLRTIVSYSVRPKWRDRRDHRDAMIRGAIDFLACRWGQGPLT